MQKNNISKKRKKAAFQLTIRVDVHLLGFESKYKYDLCTQEKQNIGAEYVYQK